MKIKDRIAARKTLWMQGRKCHLCGGEIYRISQATLDHIVTVSDGGSDELDNLSLAHGPCNMERGDLSMDDWRNRREH